MVDTIKGFTVFGKANRRRENQAEDVSQSVGVGRWNNTYVELHQGGSHPSLTIGGVTTDHGPYRLIDVNIRFNCMDEIFAALCQIPRYRCSVDPKTLETADRDFASSQKASADYRSRQKSILGEN